MEQRLNNQDNIGALQYVTGSEKAHDDPTTVPERLGRYWSTAKVTGSNKKIMTTVEQRLNGQDTIAALQK